MKSKNNFRTKFKLKKIASFALAFAMIFTDGSAVMAIETVDETSGSVAEEVYTDDSASSETQIDAEIDDSEEVEPTAVPEVEVSARPTAEPTAKPSTSPKADEVTPTPEPTATPEPTEQPEDTEETTVTDQASLLEAFSNGGSSDAGGSGVSENTKFVPGTYTVTANLYVPGELNAVLGVNAYLTNPNNPLGIAEDNGAIESVAPITYVTSNATLTIGEDGVTKTLTIPVKNPVFTLQSIESGSNVTIKDSVRNSNTYGSYTGRITSLTVELGDNSGSYVFGTCKEFPTLLGYDWNVTLYLAVDMASIPSDTSVKVTAEKEAKWTKGSAEKLSFVAEKSFDSFGSILVDDKTVDAKKYKASAKDENTSIVLNSAYLEKLSVGSHKLTIKFKDETEGNISFTVEKKAKEKKDDKKDDASKLKAGTYQITANLYIPGELNKQLPGVTAYMTNPNNPLGIGGHEGIPMDPVKNNATLVVDSKGNKTVIVDIVNPVFTLQKITNGKKIEVLSAVWDKETYTGVSGVESRTGRITKLYLKLKDDSGTYKFGNCTEFPTLLETDWNVQLTLGVEFSSAKKTSDSTEVNLPEDGNKGDTNTNNQDKIDDKKDENKDDSKSEDNNNKNNESNNTDNNNNSNQNSKLQAGTYTVAANIWFDKSAAGLPLSPHLTSSVFPPKDPVSNNATLTVDENGYAKVSVPICIPSQVMYVNSIDGLNIVDTSYGSNGVSNIVVDLGIITDPNAVITSSCSVNLTLGSLAQSITKKDPSQVWTATFQVSLSGVPVTASGGGNVDVNSLIASASNTTEVKIGTLPGTSSLANTEMMLDAKEEESKSNTQNASIETSKTSTEETYKYTFKVEKLKDEDKVTDGKLSDEEKSQKETEKLENQLIENFEDGDYDIIVCPVAVATKLWNKKNAEKNIKIVSIIENKTKSDDDKAEETEFIVTIASKTFADKNENVLKDYLSKSEKSAEKLEKNSGDLAKNSVELGLFEDENSFKDVNYSFDIKSGEDMQKLLEDNLEKSELPSEELYYIENSKKSYDKEEDSETSESSEDSKIDFTNEDALSAALDKAVENKKSDSKSSEEKSNLTTDENGVTTDDTGAIVIDADESEKAAKKLETGTYTISANMYLPGELNTQLPNTTAYMTNPDNPLGVGGHEGIPTIPVLNNATLVVDEDGNKTVEIEIVNPVFTLQNIADPENSVILAGVRDDEWYAGTNDVGVTGRITKLYIKLLDDSGTYSFDTCAEFPTLLELEWNVPLKMSVDFSSAKKTSDETTLEIPKDSANVASETKDK